MLTAAAVARHLGISPRTVYALAESGALACYRFGSAVRFDPADVEGYRAATHRLTAHDMRLPDARGLRVVDKLHRRAGMASPLSAEEAEIAYGGYRNECAVPWANKTAIRAIYAEAERITAETGIAHHVDHIIPLRGAFVCGLHVESNLRVVPAAENIRKGNKVGPAWQTPPTAS